jgi:hypothetical protein
LNAFDPDKLTREFLNHCYESGVGFRLRPWGGLHEPNTKGVARALAWLQVPPEIVVSKETNVDEHSFPMRDGTTIQLAEGPTEVADLAARRAAHTTGKGGTGVNEYSPFVWCNYSVDELAADSLTATEFIQEISSNYVPETGFIKLDMFALDHVGINGLVEKAKARGVVGPLRLSANVLIADPDAGSVVVQQKRDKKKNYPRHTFGGAFMVADPKQEDSYLPSDGSDMVRCARREVLEESNIALPLSSRRPFRDIPALLLLQTDPPFLQTCFLGWQAPTAEIEHCFEFKSSESNRPNEEGFALRIPLVQTKGRQLQSVAESFSEPAEARKPWRPTGLLALYAWYRIGCPGIREEAKKRLEDELSGLGWGPKNDSSPRH